MFNHPPCKCGIYRRELDAICTTNQSCVYRGNIVATGEKVVLKFIPLKPETIQYAQNECNIQNSLHHPFIMPIKNSNFTYRKDSFTILQMPVAECSLAQVHECIHDIKDIYKIMYQALLAISYLHEMRILHGDIKPENFVLMSGYQKNIEIRVIDFGHSIQFENDDMDLCVTNLASGTTTFNSPELLIKASHSFPADIWSLGATFYYLITGESVIPFVDSYSIMYENSKHIDLSYTKKFGPSFPKSGADFIKNMVKFDPKLRPTALECLKSPFFNEVLDEKWIESQHLLVNQMKKDNTVVPNVDIETESTDYI